MAGTTRSGEKRGLVLLAQNQNRAGQSHLTQLWGKASCEERRGFIWFWKGKGALLDRWNLLSLIFIYFHWQTVQVKRMWCWEQSPGKAIRGGRQRKHSDEAEPSKRSLLTNTMNLQNSVQWSSVFLCAWTLALPARWSTLAAESPTLPTWTVVMAVISGSSDSSFPAQLSPQGNYELITSNQHITAWRFTLTSSFLLREFGPSGVSGPREDSKIRWHYSLQITTSLSLERTSWDGLVQPLAQTGLLRTLSSWISVSPWTFHNLSRQLIAVFDNLHSKKVFYCV